MVTVRNKKKHLWSWGINFNRTFKKSRNCKKVNLLLSWLFLSFNMNIAWSRKFLIPQSDFIFKEYPLKRSQCLTGRCFPFIRWVKFPITTLNGHTKKKYTNNYHKQSIFFLYKHTHTGQYLDYFIIIKYIKCRNAAPFNLHTQNY